MKNFDPLMSVLLGHVVLLIVGMILVYFNVTILGTILMIAGLPISALFTVCQLGKRMKALDTTNK